MTFFPLAFQLLGGKSDFEELFFGSNPLLNDPRTILIIDIMWKLFFWWITDYAKIWNNFSETSFKRLKGSKHVTGHPWPIYIERERQFWSIFSPFGRWTLWGAEILGEGALLPRERALQVSSLCGFSFQHFTFCCLKSFWSNFLNDSDYQGVSGGVRKTLPECLTVLDPRQEILGLRRLF